MMRGAGDEQLLQWIARATAPLTGQDFFRTLMRHLAEAFGLRRAFIAECVDRPTTRVRTLAFWSDAVDLAGTPCERTIQDGRVFCVQGDLQQRYAWAERQGLDSYLGVPIHDSSGRQLIGHMAFETTGPIEGAIADRPLFQIFHSRAAAELRRKHAEEQGRRHLQQLAHVGRLSAMGQMASAIAHEINQPLTALRTFAQASQRLLAAGAAPAELSDTLGRMARQAERASEIVRRLRGFLARQEIVRAPVAPAYLVAEVIGLARADAAASGVDLQVALPPTLPLVAVDGIQIEQVLLNLVRNGIEAMQPVPRAQRRLRIEGALQDGELQLAVQDSGPGVPPEQAERIFEPFVSHKPGGMGIGLAISRSIAEAHQGRLWLAEPAPDRGARFVLALPLEDAPMAR
ncbi:sensor histidine kinase [Aquabacterium sp.]|uniref:sensor histidine kinase n=1 Tax=Aquabacterium sp. TaxID=1872578 RepID=UPI003784386A